MFAMAIRARGSITSTVYHEVNRHQFAFYCRTSTSIVLFYTRRLLIFPPWVTTTYNTFRRPFSTVWFIHFCYKVLRSFFTICKVLTINLNLLKYYKSNDSVETRDIIINNIVISIRSPLVRIIHYFIIKQNNI